MLLTLYLSSCGNNKTDDSNQEDNGETTAPEETANEIIKPNVTVIDYEGYEFNILCNAIDLLYWSSRDIYAEEMNGGEINDAVYYRNMAIEEIYNIKIGAIYPSGLATGNDARKYINAGDGVIDVHTIGLTANTSALVAEELLLDLKTVPYIDLSKPWWDQRANAQLSIGNKLMHTMSDLLIIDKDALFIFFFNKDILRDYDLENPYELVRNDKWTVDKMWEMAKKVTRELNGDGIMDENDLFGLLSNSSTMYFNVVGSGHITVVKDENDMPVLNMKDPMLQASFDKWINITNDRMHTIYPSDYTGKYADIWARQQQMFEENHGLFLSGGMLLVTLMRASECNFGILPTPKFEEMQTEYYNSTTLYSSNCVSIPITSDPERTGIILEALTAESYYTLIPAYYEISLQGKLLRDDASSEMLDLIFKTRCYDLGQVYNWGGIVSLFYNLSESKSTDFVSAYEKIHSKAESDIEKFYNEMS